MTLPNFLGIGAQRAGTTWLHAQLRSHPAIYLPPRRKELHFFDRYYDRGIAWYESCFPPSREDSPYRWFGEITPMYLFDPRVPARIKEHLPRCLFVVILRNPSDRAYSQYGHHVQNMGENRSFEDFLEQEEEVFARGLYCRQLKRYLALFPVENFLVLIFEELMKDPAGALRYIADFLNLDVEGFDQRLLGNKVNASHQVRFGKVASAARRWGEFLRRYDLDWMINAAKALRLQRALGNAGVMPKLDPQIRRRLLERYEPEIRDLEELLGRDLSLWRRPRSME
ncbi:MAG: sulfotransferase [Syntrophobacteraceae bacterium]|nr:sulfotransferase [Syntrophobacteraceae bacterium]